MSAPSSDPRMSEDFDLKFRAAWLRAHLCKAMGGRPCGAARRAWPERPGLLDLPSWVINRNWCRPRDPDGPNGPIVEACAKRISTADGVRGA